MACLDGRLSVESRDHASVSQKFKSSVSIRQDNGEIYPYTPVGSFWEITQFNWLVLKLVSEEGSSWFNSVSHPLCYWDIWNKHCETLLLNPQQKCQMTSFLPPGLTCVRTSCSVRIKLSRLYLHHFTITISDGKCAHQNTFPSSDLSSRCPNLRRGLSPLMSQLDHVQRDPFLCP